MNDLDEARSRFEHQWRRMSATLETEFGRSPGRNWRWVVLITAAASGVTLGIAWKRKRRSSMESGTSEVGRLRAADEGIRPGQIEGE